MLRVLRSRHATLGIDPENVFAWGTSEGAGLTNLGATSCGSTAVGLGTREECPTGTVSYFGPTDVVGNQFTLDLVENGCPAKTRSAPSTYSPLFYVRPGAPIAPMRIEQGLADCTVPPLQAVRLDSALRASGLSCSLTLVSGAGHGATKPPWTESYIYEVTLGWLGRAIRDELTLAEVAR